MSQDLQPILIRPETDQFPVDARSLWTELGIIQGFHDWFRIQNKRLKSVEGSDYSTYMCQTFDATGRARNRKEYALTARAAHHIAAMSEGKKAHAYRDALFNLLERIGAAPARVPADQKGATRIASNLVRNELAALWDTRGKFAPQDFGRVTQKMKSAAGISQSIRKNQMTTRELVATLAAEQLAADSIIAFDAYGKPMVEAVSIKAAKDVGDLLNGPARAAAIASLRKEIE